MLKAITAWALYACMVLALLGLPSVYFHYFPPNEPTAAEQSQTAALMEFWANPPCDLRRALGDADEYADKAAISLSKLRRASKSVSTEAVKSAEAKLAEAEGCVAKGSLSDAQRDQIILDAAKTHGLQASP